MAEIFKDIPGYEGYYQVSNLGKVIKLDRYEDMKCKGGGTAKRFRKGGEVYYSKRKRKHGDPYLEACLWKEGKVKCIGVHRLVAMAFIPNPENKKEVNHIDGKHQNNTLENLEWCTRSENELHSFRVLGKSNWNKGRNDLKTERPEIYKKLWETRRKNLLNNPT